MLSAILITGAILADQVKSLDWRAPKAELIYALPAAPFTEMLQKLNTLLSSQT